MLREGAPPHFPLPNFFTNEDNGGRRYEIGEGILLCRPYPACGHPPQMLVSEIGCAAGITGDLDCAPTVWIGIWGGKGSGGRADPASGQGSA